MPTVKCAKYLLVLVDIFSGWVEAFFTTSKRAQTVSNLLLHEIIPQLGIPTSLQSDNGPEFTSQVSQTLSKALNIPWYFQILFHSPFSGKTEWTNHSLKTTLDKLSQKLHFNWVKFLLLATFRLLAFPKQPLFNLTLWAHVWMTSSDSQSVTQTLSSN